jgi:RNA polymerase sigma-70 factor (ECF subfamily)
MTTARIVPLMRLAAEAEDPASLVTQAGRGDARAFERLYRAHVGQVYGLCLRMTGDAAMAEDCTQECFIAAWRALHGFEGRSRFATWLHRIAVNCVLVRRARRNHNTVSFETVLDEAQAVPGAPDAAGPIDLERAVASLPEGARHVLVLVGLYGYTHEEAAGFLGVAVGTCKAQLHRARGLLSARLGLTPEGA